MDNIELKVFLEAIYLKYGYDFRNYSTASIKRRIRQRQGLSKIENLAAMQHRVLHDRNFFHTLLLDLSVNVTEMFRDPSFYCALREKVIPVLKTIFPMPFLQPASKEGFPNGDLEIRNRPEDCKPSSQEEEHRIALSYSLRIRILFFGCSWFYTT